MEYILLFIFISQASLCQENKATQEYSYRRDDISVKMSINANMVTSKDTIKVTIQVKNISKSELYFVPTYHFTYTSDPVNNIFNGVYLDYGGLEDTSIFNIPFKLLPPDSSRIITRKFICDNFGHNRFTKDIPFSLALGYLKINPNSINSKFEFKESDGCYYFPNSYLNCFKKSIVGNIIIHFTK